jgi:autophagy-related protein 101
MPPAVRVARAARLQSALEDRLAAIVQAVNAKREHIPPVVSAAVVTFPFDISIAGWAPQIY